jgi:membrane fusion protein, multidrug efflux system
MGVWPRSAAVAVLVPTLLQVVWAADAPRPAAVLPIVSNAEASTAPMVAPLSQQEIRAQLSPRRYTTLAAEIGAKINRLPVPEGGTFKQGQPLIAFDCSIQSAQWQKAKAGLLMADKTWQANKRLFELNSIGRLELDLSEADIAKNKADVEAMSAVLAKCNVAAPFSGRVAEQKVREQQFVQPGQAVLDIIDDSVLELEFIVPSKWLAWLRPGYTLQVRIDETAKDYPAKIKRIGATVDPVSQSVKVVATIDGSFRELIAGMSGRVSLVAPGVPKAGQK